MKNNDIKPSMPIGELVKKYPESVPILTDNGIECVGCHVATWETIEQVASDNNIDIESLMDALHRKISH